MRNTIIAAVTAALGLAALGLAAGSMASAVTIINGGFEDPVVSGSFDTFFANNATSDDITGWVVSQGSVDVVGSLWTVNEGSQAVDLDGSSPGAIYQVISGLTLGRAYVVSFLMSGSGRAPPPIKTMSVSVGSAATPGSPSTSQDYTFVTDASNNAVQGVWNAETFAFTATGSTLRLTLTSTTGGRFAGAAIDDVSVVAGIPLPASAVLLGGGLAVLGLRRKRAAQQSGRGGCRAVRSPFRAGASWRPTQRF